MASPERPRYTLIPGTEEVTKTVPPGEERCDFCYALRPTFTYSAPDDFLTATSYKAGEGTQDNISQGEWLACDLCAHVIGKGDPELLATSIVRRSQQIRSLPQESRPMMRRLLRAQLNGLFARLLPVLGPRTPWAPDMTAPPVQNIRTQVIRHTAPDPGEPGAN